MFNQLWSLVVLGIIALLWAFLAPDSVFKWQYPNTPTFRMLHRISAFILGILLILVGLIKLRVISSPVVNHYLEPILKTF